MFKKSLGGHPAGAAGAKENTKAGSGKLAILAALMQLKTTDEHRWTRIKQAFQQVFANNKLADPLETHYSSCVFRAFYQCLSVFICG